MHSSDNTHTALDPKIRADLKLTTKPDIPIDDLLDKGFQIPWDAYAGRRRDEYIRPFVGNFLEAVGMTQSDQRRKRLETTFLELVRVIISYAYTPLRVVGMGGLMINKKRTATPSATGATSNNVTETNVAKRRFVFLALWLVFWDSFVPSQPIRMSCLGPTRS